MKLLIVESPSKAKTIAKYLGGEYEVRASVGHIRDLPKSNKKAIDIEGGFIPHYEVSVGKEKVVSEIKSLAKKANEVLLATDPDREGEAIAWHIQEACGLKGAKRVAFHEITESAIKEAIKQPREIDMNLKSAQEARRVLDRLVGYDLSGIIWKKVRYGLSAGRVQSPALRIVMEKEREIRAFIPETYFVLAGEWKTEGKIKESKTYTLALECEEQPKVKDEAERIVKVGRASKWEVTALDGSDVSRSPRAPFTTSTLQQTSSSRLGYAPSRTMGIAQKLYEKGLITYMRTDSTTLSNVALGEIANTVENTFGKNFLEVRTYKTKAKNAQEAHEAIRPTHASTRYAGTTDDEKKLYSLIWERTISSQMKDAKLRRSKVTANITNGKSTIPDFSVTGSVVTFQGWLIADPDARGDDVQLPELNVGDNLNLLTLQSIEKQTQPPSRYTEAGLIKELEKRGIGRPSTYASIISTIEDRGYVDKINKALHPTDTGEVVTTFLEQQLGEYISDTFTADMEDKLDKIANGETTYLKTLSDFYGPFLKDVKSKEKLEKATNLGDAPEDLLCPLCKAKMVIKLARNGKFYSCSKYPDCMGARKLDGTVMEGPKKLGKACPKCEKGELMEREGRYGKFIACSNYPKCKYIEQDEEQRKANSTGVSCNKCKDGYMEERKGRFGVFYSCSNYPDCKHIIKTRPTGNRCSYKKADGSICGELMMTGTKTIPERCSEKTCPNHNPHKLENKV
ncbi:TPA: type I DNA topoisomerase [Candidatus Nomurabacteria bacterium]|nr:type I DNA topoisomerase [Candidatus Nomurabacteria bacterium]